MPRIQQYQRQEGIQTGPVAGMAGEAAFGGGPQGTEAITQGLDMAADLLDRRRKQDEAMWVDNTTTKAQLDWEKSLEERKLGAGAGAPDFAGKFTKDWETYVEKTVRSAPSRSAQMALQSQFNNLGSRFQRDALHFETSERINQRVSQSEAGMDMAMALATMHPEQRDELAAKYEGQVDKLQGIVLPHQLEALSKKAAAIRIAGLEALADVDPGQAISGLEKYAGKIPGPQFSQMMGKYKGMAERFEGAKSKKFRDAATSHFEQLADTGIDDGFSLPTPEFQKQQQIAVHQFGIKQDITNAKSSEMSDVVAQFEPRPKDPSKPDEGPALVYTGKRDKDGMAILEENQLGYAVWKDLHAHAANMAKQELQLRATDPASAADNAPEVKKAQEVLERNKDPDMVPQLYQDVIEKRLNWQKAVGIPESDMQVLPKSQLGQISKTLTEEGSQKFKETITQLMQTYGKNYDKVIQGLGTLDSKHKPPTMMLIAASHVGQPYFTEIYQAMTMDPKKMETAIAGKLEGEKMTIEVSKNQNLEQFRKSVASLPRKDGSDGVADYVDAVERLAKVKLFNGSASTADDAIRKASETLIPYKFGDHNGKTFMIPLGDHMGRPYNDTDISRIKKGLEFEAGNIGRAPEGEINLDFYNVDPALSSKYTKEMLRSNIQRNGFWSMTPDGKGYQMWVPDLEGNFSRVKNGKGDPYTVYAEHLKSTTLQGAAFSQFYGGHIESIVDR